MRALILASSLAVVAAFATASCDLFHSTDWPTLCDLNADAAACGGGAGGAASSSSHATSSTHTSSSTHMTSTSSGQGAGGSGGGSGAIDCAQYCAEVTGACSGAQEQYASAMECEQICGALPMAPGAASNTAECRAAIADTLVQNPNKCSSAGPAGQPVCGGTCDAYCYLMHYHCPSEFMSISDCGTQCPGLGADPASYDDSQRSGATTTCFLYWATQAVIDPANCVNAGRASPVCVGTGGGGGSGGAGAGGSGVGGG